MLRSYFRRPTRIFTPLTGPAAEAADPDSIQYGDEPQGSWAAGTGFDDGTPAMAWVAPVKEGEEFLQDRDTWLQEYNVRYPVGTPVFGNSEIEFEGRRHRVVSRPRTFYRKSRADHIHLRMTVLENA